MAVQSIVDFVKDAQPVQRDVLAEAIPMDAALAEQAYAMLVGQVCQLLANGTELSEGALFKGIDIENIGQFRMVLGLMTQRGLTHIVKRKPPYNEPVYGLSSSPPAR